MGTRRTVRMLSLLALAGAASAAGCYKSDWEAATARVHDLEGQLAERDQKIQEDETRINGLTTERDQLRTSMDELNQRFSADTGALRANIEELQRAYDEARRLQEQQAARLARFREMAARFRAMIDSGRLHVTIRKGRMVVQMASAILFASGSAELSPEGQTALSELAAILMGITDRSFQVAGHTDNVPISTGRYGSNWELSTARAVTVVRFLQDVGVDPTKLAAVGYGEYDPIGSNDAESGRAQNRRIEFVVMPNLDELPDLSALEQDLGTP